MLDPIKKLPRDFFQESQKEGLLIIFVRHRGCTFCRESLANLSKVKTSILEKGIKPIVIHMGAPESSE
ncbi:MAG: hypothetical protein AAF203_01385, partial [Pseudomonadota bacterium]